MSANPYAAFRRLLPQRPLEIGTVTYADATGCTVELPGGGLLRVRGSAAVGDSVFVRDGLIEGAAPAYTPIVIEI